MYLTILNPKSPRSNFRFGPTQWGLTFRVNLDVEPGIFKAFLPCGVDGIFSLSRCIQSLTFTTFNSKISYGDRTFSKLFSVKNLSEHDKTGEFDLGFPYILQFWLFSPAGHSEGSDRTSGGRKMSLMATGFIFSSVFLFWETRPVTWERSKGSEWEKRESLKGWRGQCSNSGWASELYALERKSYLLLYSNASTFL